MAQRVSGARREAARLVTASGQENRHQGNDQNDTAGAVLHQLDEAFIGLLMRGVIVAVGGGVGNFVMLSHQSLQRVLQAIALELTQSGWESNGSGAVVSRLRLLFPKVGWPIIPDPAGQAFFADFARSEGEDNRRRLRGIRIELDAVF